MDAHPSESAAGGVLSVVREFVKAMRPVQWVKNVFVFAPLVFGLRLLDTPSLGLAAVAFSLFCLVSSAVYLLNDLMDRHHDARHPTKRFRPIASGRLPVEVARAGIALLLAAGVFGALAFDWRVALVLGGYFALNAGYSLQLKHYAFIDIACIATGFLLRVLAGGFAIAVPVSGWLLACTFLLASLLALGKRKHELLAVAQNGRAPGTRAVLDRYRVHHIDWTLRVLSVVTVASYALYTLSETTVAHFGTRGLVLSVPFVAIGLWRFFRLVAEHAEAQSPTDTMVRDVPFLLNVGAWAVVVTATIYFRW